MTPTDRASSRAPVLLNGRCRKTSWIISHIELVNISEGGCCIARPSGDLSEDDAVSLRFGGMKGIEGNVRWAKDGRAGIAFNEPLDRATVKELSRAYAARRTDVIDIRTALRKRAASG